MKGFTLIELVVAMGIFVTLLGIATINLSGSQVRNSINSATDAFITNLKSQQLRAMAGQEDSSGGPAPYGVYFEDASYTLFRGSTFSPSDAYNFEVKLPTGTEFFPVNSEIVFASGSGEISSNTVVTLRRTSGGNQKTLNINRYGVVEEIN